MFGLVDPSFPVNWAAPLNRWLVSWLICLPGQQRGVIWRDIARENHATLTSMDPATDWMGRRGRPGGWGCLDFDGSNDHALIASDTPDNLKMGTSDFTVAFWCQVATQAVRGIISCRGAGASNEAGWGIGTRADNNIQIHSGNGAGSFIDDTTVAAAIYDSAWHHLIIVFDRDTATNLYIDGKYSDAAGATNWDTNSTLVNFVIGRYSPSGLYYGGRLDDIRFYKGIALSAAEAYALYQASKTGYRRELNWLTTPLWAEEQVAGGTTYTFASSDSIAYSDSLAVLTSSFRATSDSIGITDDAVRACQVFRTSEDNVALSDTVDRACQNLRAVEDNVACSDTVERVVEYFRAVADSIGIADEVLREISGIREISVADSLAISEAYLQVVSYFRDLADSLAFTEDFQRQVDYYRQVSDSIAILESLITALNGIVITPPEEEEEEQAALDVEEDLYAYLLGCHIVTNLIGTRLYPVETPEAATRPLIVYEILTRERDDTQAGENGLVRVGIQFDCQAATYTAVREIEEALRGRFYRFYHRLMGTTFVQSAEISDATDEDSPPVFADAQGIYHSRVDLELWYEEAAIADGTEV